MSQDSATIPILILVEGDPTLGLEVIKGVKSDMLAAGMLPEGWVEMYPPDKKPKAGEFLNSLDGELSLSDWERNRKCVLLRGLMDGHQFLEGLFKVIQGISPTNTLIVFDEEGVIRSSKEGGWKTFRATCEKRGKVLAVPIPFKELDGKAWPKETFTNRVKAVVDEVAKRGKKISPQAAREFLEKVTHEWSHIIPEVEKLVELSAGNQITVKEAWDIPFPSRPSTPVYEFAKAFNSGMYDPSMETYDQLVASKIHPEVVVAYAMKLIRLQLIASHLLSYGQALPGTLKSFGVRTTFIEGNKRTVKDRIIHPRWFVEEKDKVKRKEKEEKLQKFDITSAAADAASAFVTGVFKNKVAVTSGVLKTLPFMRLAMLRYIAMFECMQKIRMCGGDLTAARMAFRQAVYKICWRG